MRTNRRRFKFTRKSLHPRRKCAAHRKGDDRRNIPVHYAGASTGKMKAPGLVENRPPGMARANSLYTGPFLRSWRFCVHLTSLQFILRFVVRLLSSPGMPTASSAIIESQECPQSPVFRTAPTHERRLCALARARAGGRRGSEPTPTPTPVLGGVRIFPAQ